VQKRALEAQRLCGGRARFSAPLESSAEPLHTAAQCIGRDTRRTREAPPIIDLSPSIRPVIVQNQRPALGRQARQALLETLVQGVARVGWRRVSKIRQLWTPVDRHLLLPAQSLQEHQPRDSTRVAPDVVDRGLALELQNKAIERFVGAFVRRPRPTPIEELHQREPEALVLRCGPVGIRIEACEQVLKAGGRQQAGIRASATHRGPPESYRVLRSAGAQRFSTRSERTLHSGWVRWIPLHWPWQRSNATSSGATTDRRDRLVPGTFSRLIGCTAGAPSCDRPAAAAPLRLVAAAAVVGVCVVYGGNVTQLGATRSVQDERLLALGTVIERDLSAGQPHTYRLTLATGEFVSIRIEQRGLDVAVSLARPDGRELLVVDASNRDFQRKTVLAIADMSGVHAIAVRAARRGPAGRYAIHVDELRPATPSDTTRIEAERALERDTALSITRQPAGFRNALGEFRDALPGGWGSARRGERRDRLADALTALSLPEALASARLAEELARGTRDEAARARALRVLGNACDCAGDRPTALRAYEESAGNKSGCRGQARRGVRSQ